MFERILKISYNSASEIKWGIFFVLAAAVIFDISSVFVAIIEHIKALSASEFQTVFY